MHDGNNYRVRHFLRIAGVCGWMIGRRRETAFEVGVVCAIFALYCANRFYSLFDFAIPSEFANNHLNDLFAGVLFPAYVNLLLIAGKRKRRVDRPLHALSLGLLCGVAWEIVAPFIYPDSVSDIVDGLCYIVGCYSYIAIRKAMLR